MVVSYDQRFVTADGLELAANLAGNPADPPVILLHGGGQTRFSWKNGQAEIASAGYRVLSYDVRGHGESSWDPAGDYGADALVRDLRSIVAKFPEPPVLIGASLGGLTSLIAEGESVRPLARALVLVDITSNLENEGTRRVKEFMIADREGFANVEEVADAISRYNPARSRPSSLTHLSRNLREVEGRLYWHWDPRFLQNKEAKFPRTRLEAAVRRIAIPVLLIRGGDSDLVERADVDSFSTLMPLLEVVEVPGAGHMVAGDRNDAFIAEALRFLRKLDGERTVVASNR